MKANKSIKKGIKRVDYQAAIIITVILTLSFLCIYIYNYNATYNDMLHSLKKRSDSIYGFVEKQFDKATFYEADKKEDMNKEIYLRDKAILENVKEASDVLYLYTAKKNEAGDFIYVLDGLPSDSPDFRFPGDLIEPEIVTELEQALQNKIIYPEDIKATDWGKIFVSYYPIHEKDEIIGVIGIEFDASSQYNTFQEIRVVTSIIGGIFGLIAIVVSVVLFRRISNPSYKDLANTDYLTGVKNRNAFEVDMHNIVARKMVDIGFISVDLNDLKQKNDEKGHAFGDTYIKECAKVLERFENDNATLYRVGGDEFIYIIMHASEEEVDKHIESILCDIETYNEQEDIFISIAFGGAVFDAMIDENIYDTFNRADEKMYERKREMKNNKE